MSSAVAEPRTVVRTGPVDAGPPPRATGERTGTFASQVLFAFALLLGWVVLYLGALSGFEESHDQHGLYSRLRSELAEGTAPTGAPIEAGAPVALLSAPDAGIEDLVVVEGTRSDQLKAGPGHALGSVLPGQQGTSVLRGRSLTFGAPFGRLGDLAVGDHLQVVTGQGEFSFRVSGTRRAGDPVPPAVGAGKSRLTLVTSVGHGPLSRLRPSETYYVDADLLGKAVVAGPVGTADPDGVGMKPVVTAGALAQLALGIQLLVVALAGAVWAWYRWSRTAAWITGVPVVLAAAWLVSSLLSRLLPALI